MGRLPGYALVLGVTQQDPAISRMPLNGEAQHTEVLEYIDTGRVTLQPDFDVYWRQRSRDLRESIARRRRRLEREGTLVRLLSLNKPSQVVQGIHDFSRMEEGGWKAVRGTSVGIGNAQGRFYTTMLQELCERGEGVIYQLMFDDKAVASQICVERGRMSVSLKIAYDEALRSYAPGFILQEEIIRRLHQQPGLEVIEFYGRATPGWTRKWTDDVRTMYHLNFFRSEALRNGLQLLKWILHPRASSSRQRLETAERASTHTERG
jgi:CelD/BcsL family acetyltransferase involved in cellulose biosynthesis